MTTVANASVVFKDKNGNVGTVKGASANDITKISNAISDVAQVVNPTTHLPIQATTSSVGVVQLADSAAVSAGTSGRVVDAAQLKDAIEHVTPAGNLMTLDTAQTVTAVKTFSSLPESSVAPTTDNQLVNKKYVDDHATPVPTNIMTTDTAQTVTAVKTFSTLPESSVAPTTANQLVNKQYVDAHATPTPTNMMTIDTAQTVSAVKTFSALPQSSVTPTNNNDLVNKAYVDAHLNLKADTDFRNINDTAKNAIAHNAMPTQGTYDDLTLGTSGSTYTAPADGYIAISKNATAVGQQVNIATNNIINRSYAPAGSAICTLFIPIAKGNRFLVQYNSDMGTTNYFRFLYVVGAISEKA